LFYDGDGDEEDDDNDDSEGRREIESKEILFAGNLTFGLFISDV
jgi:hypothetical protein